MDMIALPRRLYDRAVKLNVTKIILEFSGGSDEAYLNVSLVGDGLENTIDTRQLASDIESWAEDAFSYGGSGDGNSYGDTYCYDLTSMTTTHSSWYTTTVDGDGGTSSFEIDEEAFDFEDKKE